MANDLTTDQQQLQSTIDELYQKLSELFPAQRDALRNALNTIQVGENQALGMLAAADDLASAPIGDPAALRDRLNLEAVLGALANLDTLSEAEVGDAAGLRQKMGLRELSLFSNLSEAEAGNTANLAKKIKPAVDSITRQWGGGNYSEALQSPDLNTLTSDGFYYIINPKNGPDGTSNGYLSMQSSAFSGYSVQRYVLANRPAAVIFYRVNYIGSWGPWARLDGAGGIESGSNSLGYWVRWPDGHQQCFGSVNIDGGSGSYTEAVWTFPKSFNGSEVFAYGTLNTTVPGGTVQGPGVYGAGSNSCTIRVLRSNSTGTNVVCQAAGRWK